MMPKNVLGIVYSNSYDSCLKDFTQRRTMGSMLYGARYRLIDFVLSNLVNSGVTKVGVITNSHYRSLMDHVGNGRPWDLARKVDGLYLLPPFNPTHAEHDSSNKLEVLGRISGFLKSCSEKYVLLSDANFICNKYNESRLKISKTLEQLRVNRLSLELTEICEWFLYDYFEPTKDVYDRCATVRIKVDELASNKYLKRVMTPSNNSTVEKIDFNKHLLNRDIVIMNTKNTILGPLGKTFGEFIMLEFLNATFRRKHYAKEMGHVGQVPPHFLYIDEFATYSPVLTEMFTQGRSFRVGTHIAVQNRALLQMCGDELTEAQSLLIESNARNLVLFPGLNGEDARYYSAQFYNLKPEEICYRPFGQICYRVVANKSISRPGVGLVFFIDQTPNTDSIKLEERYKSNGRKYKKIT